MPISGIAQIVDDWATPHGVLNANDGNSGLVTATVTQNSGTVILGGERDIRVVRDSVSGQVSSEAFIDPSSGIGNLDHSQTSAAQGRSFIEWDGIDGDATAAGFDETGLGGLDLVNECSSSNPSFTFRANNTDNNSDVDVTIEVYTDASNWSSLTQTETGSDGVASLLTYPFSSFVAQAGTGADFSDVGAVRLIIETNADGADLTILSPASGCESDLGDAAARNLFATLVTVDSRIQAAGPRHIIAGPRLGNNIDAEESTAIPDGPLGEGEAVLDDNTGSPDDEDGVTFPAAGTTSYGAGDTYTVTATVTNVGADTPLLCGWIDFSDIDTEAGFGFENDADERVCVAVTDPNPGSTGDVCDDISGGSGTSFECELDFVIPTDWNGGPGVNDGGTDSAFLARFRVTTDWATTADSNFNGFASDGEVEDYLISSESLPVSISGFNSSFTSEGLVVEWTTASETRNAGFFVWGDLGGEMRLLTDRGLPAGTRDPAQPGAYRHVIPGISESAIGELAVTAVDLDGNEKVYGVFDAGKRYGTESATEPVAWDDIRSAAFARMSQRGSSQPASVEAVDVEVFAEGMQSVSWQMLFDAGLDLTGVNPDAIAVTRNGEPVARRMVSGAAGGFQPGDAIHFWGEKPEGRDALYVDRYRYRIRVHAADAVAAVEPRADGLGDGPAFYAKRLFEDADNAYHMSSALEDPWYAARLRADRTNTYTTAFTVGADLVAGQPGWVEVRVAGLTDFPADPDHHVRVAVNGVEVGELIFEGQTVQLLDYAIPAGLLVPGVNEVTVSAPGGTAAAFDISLVDTVALEYAAALTVEDGRLLMPAVRGTETYRLRGLGGDAEVYAWNGQTLHALAAQTTVAYDNPDVLFRANFEPNEQVPQALAFNTVDGTADYWASTTSRLHHPGVVGTLGENALFDDAGSPDFLVIGHPAFLPLSSDEPHPLNEFLALKRSEGWSPALFDITELQARYSGGMPLPEAVNRFLADADGRFTYEHVLLVGGDSYDYTDNLGLGSISFIPTHYAATRFIPHTPSDALLADLDGDGLSDKALGRWPVRNQGDLQSIVDKTIAWSNDPQPLSNAAFVTDTQDPAAGSFTGQADGLASMLTTAGWSETELAQIYYDELIADPGLSVADTARGDLFARLAGGRSLTAFVGHGSPSMWTFQGLLVPDDLNELYNEGAPTLIGTLTCYTSYFVSPYSDTVAHRWMNGYREDGAGNPLPGVANGAVAVHGAATLSNYDQNGLYARDVMDFQLAGNTLGQAVHLARQEAARRNIGDLVINWILLGDPTLRLD